MDITKEPSPERARNRDVEKLIAGLRAQLEAVFPDYQDVPRLADFIRRALTDGYASAVMDIVTACGAERPSALHKDHITNTTDIVLPQVAPELYTNRSRIRGRRENIIGFLRRVWKPWMDARLLTRKKLKELDTDAYDAVNNWLRHTPLPNDIYLPTQREINDTLILQDGTKPPDQLRRLAYVLQTRARRHR